MLGPTCKTCFSCRILISLPPPGHNGHNYYLLPKWVSHGVVSSVISMPMIVTRKSEVDYLKVPCFESRLHFVRVSPVRPEEQNSIKQWLNVCNLILPAFWEYPQQTSVFLENSNHKIFQILMFHPNTSSLDTEVQSSKLFLFPLAQSILLNIKRSG